MLSPDNTPLSQKNYRNDGLAIPQSMDVLTDTVVAHEDDLSIVQGPQQAKPFKFKLTVLMLCTISVVVAMGMK